ncbi:MAG: amidohydrolase family protein, partial [Candidatus Eiseniibacteriota bacterium]
LENQDQPSQEAIFRRVKGFYPRGTRFVVLPMDMDFMGAGRAPLDYPKQLEGLAALHAAYPDVVIPFVAADPRRPDVETLVREYVERHGFGGIKLYPPLGYWPFDDRLRPIYAYAQQRGLPVLTHCARGGAYFKGAVTEDMRRHPRTGRRLGGDDNQTFTDHYTHPTNFVPVLEEFPRLKLCFAHYGGGEEWRSHLSDPWQDGDEKSWLAEINDILRNPAWPDVFADVSATAASPRSHALLKMLIEAEDTGSRILYGSDFYMVQRDATEREFSINLRGYIGEANWRKIAVDNPLRFLAPI